MIQVSGPGTVRTGAGNDYEVLDLATCRALLLLATGTGNDVVIQKLLDGVHQVVWKYTNRIFKLNATPYVQVYECGDMSQVLRLHQWPLDTVTGLEAGWIKDSVGTFEVTRAYTTDEFYIDKPQGLLRAIRGVSFNYFSETLRVTYTAGYASGQVPADIQRALADWVGVCLKRTQMKSWDVASEAFNNEAKTFVVDEMPKATKAVLDRYGRMEALIG